MVNIWSMMVTVFNSIMNVKMRMTSIARNSVIGVLMFMMTIFMAMAMFVVNHSVTMIVSMFLA